MNFIYHFLSLLSFKVRLFWEGHKNLELSFTLFDIYYCLSNVVEDNFKFLWPSQKIWTFKKKNNCCGIVEENTVHNQFLNWKRSFPIYVRAYSPKCFIGLLGLQGQIRSSLSIQLREQKKDMFFYYHNFFQSSPITARDKCSAVLLAWPNFWSTVL